MKLSPISDHLIHAACGMAAKDAIQCERGIVGTRIPSAYVDAVKKLKSRVAKLEEQVRVSKKRILTLEAEQGDAPGPLSHWKE